MHSRRDARGRRRRRVLPATVLALVVAAPPIVVPPASVLAAAGQTGQADRAGSPPSAVEIAKAVETVKKDPNLSTEMTIKTLRWIGKRKPAEKRANWPMLAWLREFVRWFERSSRLLMYAAVAILAAWLALSVVRLVRSREPRDDSPDPFVAPTHVRDLDIRPEALPPNIGAAARALWDRGDHRAALALLYRGLLSRLVHAHRVPIRDSSTEGDCLALATDHLTGASRRDYAWRLIGIWQRAVYGSQDPTSAAVYDLCDEFASALDLKAATQVATQAASTHGGGAA